VPEIRQLFLDYDGVLNDNSQAKPVWERLVGEFLTPRLGGSPEAWAAANRASLPAVMEREAARWAAWDVATGNVLETARLYNIDWLRSMCAVSGIEAPADDETCNILAYEAINWIRPQARSPLPGVPETVHALAKGYVLCTATGGLSYQITESLRQFGIVSLFHRIYGPDLVNTPKQLGPLFYERIIADAGATPAKSLVVDDTPWCVAAAHKAGAEAVLVSPDGAAHEGLPTIRSLSELPELLLHL